MASIPRTTFNPDRLGRSDFFLSSGLVRGDSFRTGFQKPNGLTEQKKSTKIFFLTGYVANDPEILMIVEAETMRGNK